MLCSASKKAWKEKGKNYGKGHGLLRKGRRKGGGLPPFRLPVAFRQGARSPFELVPSKVIKKEIRKKNAFFSNFFLLGAGVAGASPGKNDGSFAEGKKNFFSVVCCRHFTLPGLLRYTAPPVPVPNMAPHRTPKIGDFWGSQEGG